MKSIITLSAITVLAAFALVGCNQNSPSNSTDMQTTNSSASDTNAMATATNSIPSVPGTNMPASTNQ
jgi:uncharacterized lipoprotein NlpE involved in copper resistance